MTPYLPNTLLNDLNEGRIKAFGWGCGEVFHAIRNVVHSFPLVATIHDAQDLHGTFVNGVKIVAPGVLAEVDPTRTLVICYSKDFRYEVHHHCGRYPGLKVIDWDDRRLVDNDRPARLAAGIALARHHGLLSHAQSRQILKRAAVSGGQTPAFGYLAERIHVGYDLMEQYRGDVYNALTKHVHFMHAMQMPGDIAEFGTATGGTATFLAAAMGDASSYRGDRRFLHLFDSFQGLPEITDPLDIKAGWKQGDFRDKTAAELVVICLQYIHEDQIKVYEGWYKDTLSSIPNATKYGLVHIDCDTYESTSQVLKYLLTNEHIADGCGIFFDDWNCSKASPQLGERKAWSEAVEEFGINFSDCGDYSVFGHKFIVHD